MPDYFESGILTDNEPAWHGAGIVVEDEVLTKQVVFERLPLLASRVVKVPLYGAHVGDDGKVHVIDTSGLHANVREADHKMLGVVKGRYTLVQNDELFDFAESIIDAAAHVDEWPENDRKLAEEWAQAALNAGPAVWKTAGTLKEGKDVWGMLRLPGDVEIAGVPEERMVPFLSVHNSFDGLSGVRAIVHWTRIVCSNTQAMAFREAPRTFSIRHTEGIQGRLLQARSALGIAYKNGDLMRQLGDTLIAESMTDRDFDRFLRELMPMTPEAVDSTKVRQNIMERRDALKGVRDLDNLANIKDTKWGALQATLEYEQHHAYPDRSAEQRLNALVKPQEYAPKALEILTAA